MEHSVRLSRLLDNVAFPERLRDRVSFDPARGQLTFRGFMTKCTYDELAALDDDADYRRALEQLFVLTSEEVAPPAKSRGVTAILLATVATAVLAAVVIWAIMRPSAEQPASAMPTATVATAS